MDSSIDGSEEAIKRNTDCVYFLASPLTCKKGSECEFRHSEIARLNPRECWYWFNRSCLNPTCAFRHPPLEGYSENPPESAKARPYTKNKSSVPCFFYFNAHCIKGDQCPFMHDLAPAKKVTDPAADLSIARPLGTRNSFGSDTGLDKNPAGSDTGPPSIEVPADPIDDASDVIKQIDSGVIVPQPVTDDHVEESPSTESSSPDYEEPAVDRLPSIDFDNGEPVCTDQSSEEIENECTEQDEWLESSPGFDVLVDNGSEHFAYDDDDDDADHLLGDEREPERLHYTHLFQYDLRDSAGYDHMDYPELGYEYDQSIYDSYVRPAEDRRSPEYFHRVSEIPRERMLEPVFQRKRRPMHRDSRDGNGLDLRDHLRKRSRLDTSRRQHNSRSRNRSREHILPYRPFQHGRLASEIQRKMSIPPHSDTDSGLNFRFRRSRPSNSRSGRYRSRERGEQRERISERRKDHPSPALYSEVHRISNGKRTLRVANEGVFSGPKTLAQIREEKNKVMADNNHPIRRRRKVAPDFEGPRPLGEILNEKRKSTRINSRGNDREYDGSGDYQSDFVDDDDDEEDGFHKKLANILGQ